MSGQSRSRLLECIVIIGIILVLAAIFLPAIEQTRSAARRTTSGNNLRVIGFAIDNYSSAHLQLPASNTKYENVVPNHSWEIRVMPLLESNNLPSLVDWDFPWNDVFNASIFTTRYPTFENPRVDGIYDSNGYALNHYSLNSDIDFKATKTLSQLDGNVVLLGEVARDYSPWGRPHNFRSYSIGTTSNKASFGAPVPGEMGVLRADLSVDWVESRNVTTALNEEFWQVSPRGFPDENFSKYSCQANYSPPLDGFVLRQECKGKAWRKTDVAFDDDSVYQMKGTDNLRGLVLTGETQISEEGFRQLGEIHHIKALDLRLVNVNETKLRSLAKMQNLEVLVLGESRPLDSQIDEFRQACPNCEVRISLR
jgi:type II secretory pathway pseudopilin PulG